MAFTSDELAMLESLTKEAITAIGAQDWTGNLLTEEEKNLIGMTVSWTYARLTRGKNPSVAFLDHG